MLTPKRALVASLLLVAMPGAPSSVLAPSSDGLHLSMVLAFGRSQAGELSEPGPLDAHARLCRDVVRSERMVGGFE